MIADGKIYSPDRPLISDLYLYDRPMISDLYLPDIISSRLGRTGDLISEALILYSMCQNIANILAAINIVSYVNCHFTEKPASVKCLLV